MPWREDKCDGEYSVEDIIRDAAARGACDIHFEPRRGGIVIRERIGGELYERASLNGADAERLISRIKIMAGMDVTERRRPQDGAIRNGCVDENVSARVSSLPTLHGEKIAVRILDRHAVTPFGISEREKQLFSRIMSLRGGLVLIAGHVGSGKTTTMYGLLRSLSSRGVSIVTLEDPVECELDGINQVPVGGACRTFFSDAVRAVLRQDPEIIAVGEIRDVDSADAAMRASSTGKLTLATVHSDSALSLPDRMAEFGIREATLYGALRGVVVQRLQRSKSGAAVDFGIAVCDGGDVIGRRFTREMLLEADVMLADDMKTRSGSCE